MPFSDDTPDVELLPHREVRVKRAFFYATPEPIGRMAKETRIHIRKGFVSNLASVPRPLWPLFPPNGDYAQASIVHDRLYHDPRVGNLSLTRAEADKVMLFAMIDSGVGWITRWAIYAGLRLGGWLRWNQLRDESLTY